MSLPSRTPASPIDDLPLPPSASPRLSMTHLAPRIRHVYSGLYLANRSVVGTKTLTALTRLAPLGASRSMPARDSPIVLSSNASRADSWLVIVVLVVLAADRIFRMSGAAAP